MKYPSFKARSKGFTLLELLIALAVFSVLSVMAYGGLRAVLNARNGAEQQSERMATLQTAFMWMGRDVEQALPRTVRDQYGEKQKAMTGSELQEFKLELTHAGWSNPFPSEKRQRSLLQRVAYGLNEKQLVRRYWFDLDRDDENTSFETVLLEGVTGFEVRYVDRNQQWQTQWPPDQAADVVQDALPQAVEVTLELEGMGKITRLFRVPEGMAAQKGAPRN